MRRKRKVQTVNDLVTEKTSLDLSIPQDIIKEVVNAQTSFTITKIREGGLEGVMWPLFGKVRVKVSRIKMINDYIGGLDVRNNTKSNK